MGTSRTLRIKIERKINKIEVSMMRSIYSPIASNHRHNKFPTTINNLNRRIPYTIHKNPYPYNNNLKNNNQSLNQTSEQQKLKNSNNLSNKHKLKYSINSKNSRN